MMTEQQVNPIDEVTKNMARMTITPVPIRLIIKPPWEVGRYVLQFLSPDEIRYFMSAPVLDELQTYIRRLLVVDDDDLLATIEAKAPLILPSYKIERRLSRIIGGDHIAKGNSAIDITKGNMGIDVKCQSYTSETRLSRESSAKQIIDNDIVGAIKNDMKAGNYSQIFNQWNDALLKKFATARTGFSITDIFYTIFLSSPKGVELAVARIDTEVLEMIIRCGPEAGISKTTNCSMWFNGYLPKSSGQIKLYTGKTRMELRVTPKCIPKIPLFDLNTYRRTRGI